MFKTVFFLFLVICSLSATAQTNAIEAKAAYMLAEESYDKGDYQAALKFLQTTKNHLGTVNSKILYLETQAYAELHKTDKAYSPQLIKSIESFQAAPDIESFNEDKVLEIIKLKITIADQVEREGAIAREKLQKEQDKLEREQLIAKRFNDYGYPNWPYDITIEELKSLNADSLLFKTPVKKQFYKASGTTKYYQAEIAFNKVYNRMPENYIANNVIAAFTKKDGRIYAYDRLIYQKSKKDGDFSLEETRAEVVKLIAKQSELFGQEALIFGTRSNTTTNSYYWYHGNKYIYWHVLSLPNCLPVLCKPNSLWSFAIVEEIVQL